MNLKDICSELPKLPPDSERCCCDHLTAVVRGTLLSLQNARGTLLSHAPDMSLRWKDPVQPGAPFKCKSALYKYGVGTYC